MYNCSLVTYEESYEVSLYSTLIDADTSYDTLDTIEDMEESPVFPAPEGQETRRGRSPRRASPGCKLLSRDQVVENPFEEGSYIFQEFLEPDELEQRRIKNLKDAQHRASNMVRAIALSNKWDAFLTLTFNDNFAPVAGVSYDEALKCASSSMKMWKSIYPTFSYLLVPEQGEKNGRWHFHALVAGLPHDFYKFSGHFTKSHDKIYNLPSWKYGFTTATMVKSGEKVARYIAKYITKATSRVPFGCKRYLCSQGLRNAYTDRQKFLFEHSVSMNLKDLCLSFCSYAAIYSVPIYIPDSNQIFAKCYKFTIPRAAVDLSFLDMLPVLSL